MFSGDNILTLPWLIVLNSSPMGTLGRGAFCGSRHVNSADPLYIRTLHRKGAIIATQTIR